MQPVYQRFISLELSPFRSSSVATLSRNQLHHKRLLQPQRSRILVSPIVAFWLEFHVKIPKEPARYQPHLGICKTDMNQYNKHGSCKQPKGVSDISLQSLEIFQQLIEVA
jgi:hypothetical protein